MNINRHNYEEFFLMYADNELSAADRKAVDIFVAENRDLKNELEMLLQTVMPADDVVFADKTVLLKEEITSLQERLLLYADDELDATAKQEVAHLLSNDAVAAKEFALLQQTKLQPDTTVVFADKKSLYRKEEGKLVRFAWLRIAAAAVLLLGFGTWAALTLFTPAQQNSGGPVTAATDINTTPPANSNVINTTPAAPTTNTITPAVAAVVNLPATPVKEAASKNNRPAENGLPQNQQVNNTAVASETGIKKPTNNLPQPLYNNFNNNNSNETIIAAVKPAENATEKVNSGKTDLIASSNKLNTEAVNGYALNASFNPDDADKSDNKVLYMDEENVKRTKLGGLIRKVKRLVERNTNIKTDNSIKIAGFDIALNK